MSGWRGFCEEGDGGAGEVVVQVGDAPVGVGRGGRAVEVGVLVCADKIKAKALCRGLLAYCSGVDYGIRGLFLGAAFLAAFFLGAAFFAAFLGAAFLAAFFTAFFAAFLGAAFLAAFLGAAFLAAFFAFAILFEFNS